jgi:hypothetical protein
MLVITAEIWPGGDKNRKRTIAEMLVANESNLAAVSSYSAVIFQAADPGSGAAAWRSESVIHGHRRADGAWALVQTILNQTLPTAVDNERPTAKGSTDA